MSQPEYIHYLYPPKQPVNISEAPTLTIGKKYRLRHLKHSNGIQHGLIGDYQLNLQTAEITPLSGMNDEIVSGYFWDSHCDLEALSLHVEIDRHVNAESIKKYRLDNNRLEIQVAALHGPVIAATGQSALLSLSPHFEVRYSTDAFSAQLSLLHLVQTRRFFTLANGKCLHILDSGEEDQAVLHLSSAEAQQPMAWSSPVQQQGTSQIYQITNEISQAIPAAIDNQPVIGLTVLERYSSYWLQRALPFNSESIWTPLAPPISWGWSIRVGRRYDGEWDIMRRKLMLPISGADGLQLPLWKRNSLACAGNFIPED